MQAEGRRNKVPLEKGFSQVSWLKLTKSNTDLTGAARCKAGEAPHRPRCCTFAAWYQCTQCGVQSPVVTASVLTAWLGVVAGRQQLVAAYVRPTCCWTAADCWALSSVVCCYCGRCAAGGQGRRKDITLEEVRQHRTPEDAWMVLHGKVS